MAKGANATKSRSLPIGIGMGAFVSLILTLIVTAAMAMLIEGGKLSPGATGYGVMVLLMVCSLAGAMVANSRIKAKRMIVSLMSAMCYFIILLCITALFFDGMYRGIPATALVVFAGGIIAGLMPLGQGRPNRARKRKKRYG